MTPLTREQVELELSYIEPNGFEHIARTILAHDAAQRAEVDGLKKYADLAKVMVTTLTAERERLTQELQARCTGCDDLTAQLAQVKQRYHEVSSEANTLLEQRDIAVQQLAAMTQERDELVKERDSHDR